MALLKLLLVAGYRLDFFMTTTYKRTPKPLFMGNSERHFLRVWSYLNSKPDKWHQCTVADLGK
jgi:hypothetical protein